VQTLKNISSSPAHLLMFSADFLAARFCSAAWAAACWGWLPAAGAGAFFGAIVAYSFAG